MLSQDVTQTNLLIYSALNLQQVAKQASPCQALCCAPHVSLNTVAQIFHVIFVHCCRFTAPMLMFGMVRGIFGQTVHVKPNQASWIARTPGLYDPT